MSRDEPLSKVSPWSIGKGFLIVFLPCAILLGGALFAIYYAQVKDERVAIKHQTSHVIGLAAEMIATDFDLIVSDLIFLSKHNELQSVLHKPDVASKAPVAAEYLSFSRAKRIYDQIRFLDDTGMEIVRVNFDDGNPRIVPDAELQSKGERYYFKDTFVLAQGEVFVSPFDLNIEHGAVERPIKPMIRFGTPVFDRGGVKKGIVLLNYLGAKMLDNLESISTYRSQIMLLSSNGYWLKGPVPEDEWGFMFEDRTERTFGNRFPEAWHIIRQNDSGHFSNSQGMFTYATVYPLAEGQKSSTGSQKAHAPSERKIDSHERYWKVVCHIPAGMLNSVYTIARGFLLLYVILLMMLAAVSYTVARATAKRRQAEEALVRQSKELAISNDELRAVNEELEAFTYSVSHDLRAPLRGINGFSRALLEDHSDKLSDEGKDWLGRICGAIEHMGQLIDDLLGLSRITRAEMTRNTVDVTELANLVATQLQENDPTREVEFAIQHGMKANGDPRFIRIILENLLGNARKFTGKISKPRIEVGSMQAEGTEAFFVRDNGAGFDKTYADKLFGAFQRLHSADEFPGTGIGLATVSRIVHRHGGRAWAEGEVGKGATFYFTLG